MRKIIFLTLIAISFVCCAFNPYKPRGSGGLIGREVGYEQHLLAPNKWLITYNAGADSDKAKAWTLLYRRIDEFGKLKCANGYNILHQEADRKEYEHFSTITAQAIMECKK